MRYKKPYRRRAIPTQYKTTYHNWGNAAMLSNKHVLLPHSVAMFRTVSDGYVSTVWRHPLKWRSTWTACARYWVQTHWVHTPRAFCIWLHNGVSLLQSISSATCILTLRCWGHGICSVTVSSQRQLIRPSHSTSWSRNCRLTPKLPLFCAYGVQFSTTLTRHLCFGTSGGGLGAAGADYRAPRARLRKSNG